MKKVIPLALAAIILSSCGTYQMMTVNSANTTRDDKSGARFLENDSVKITYAFNGQNSPVSIEVRNKLDKPLYIDWQRSALIYNDSAISFTGDKIALDLATNGTTYRPIVPLIDVSGYNSSNTTGQVTLPQKTEFIPPHSFIKRTPAHMPNIIVTAVSDTSYHKIKLVSVNPGELVNAQKAVFSQSNSPVLFTCYLTLYTDDNKDKSIVYKQDFFVSEVFKTNTHPANTSYFGDGDKFYSYRSGQ